MYSSIREDPNPMRGAANDPLKPPIRMKEILKQRPIEQPSPKFIRDQISVDDINR
jgi:hypothetical protein